MLNYILLLVECKSCIYLYLIPFQDTGVPQAPCCDRGHSRRCGADSADLLCCVPMLQTRRLMVRFWSKRLWTQMVQKKMGVWLAFLDSWNGNPSRKGGKTIDLYCYIKVLKVKPVYQQMTLSPKLGVVGISTLWHFRLPLPIQMFIKVASSPRLSGIGMPSPILWSHPLKMQRIVLLSSLLWWELGTNSLITGPGEWLSFRRFTSKLSWSWSC